MRKGFITVVALLTAGLIAGCGGGSSNTDPPATGSSAAHKLLVQTFDGHHTISSGVISLEVTVAPSGSSTIKQPLELSFGGPFTSGGAGKPPESDFTINVSAQGRHGSLKLISAGGQGYITVSGQSYRMPASSYKSVTSGLHSLASAGGGAGAKSGAGAFSKLGIQPLDWLSDPQIVGNRNLNGAATTEVRAKVDVAAMLRDVSKLLGKPGSLGVSGSSALPQSIASATQKRIATALGSPSFDVWTGKSDKTVRRLTVNVTIPITGHIRTQLGGMTSAAVTLDFSYSDLNQPQTITAPSSVKPFSVFRSKVGAILQEIEGGLVTGSLTAGATTTGTSTVQLGTSPLADRKYTDCISNAAGDVKKMQRCSSLLGSG